MSTYYHKCQIVCEQLISMTLVKMKGAVPLVVAPKTTFRPSWAQYPLSKQAQEGIAPVHAVLVKRGAIVSCPDTPCNPPILPVRKGNGDLYKTCGVVIAQGFVLPPAAFPAVLSENIEGFVMPQGSTLIRYVDDLLLCSPSKAVCEVDIVALLNFLAENGLNQNCGLLDNLESICVMSLPKGENWVLRVEAILAVPKPLTKQHMMSLLGMAGYCRAWLPDYAEIVTPLQACIYGHQMTTQDPVIWSEDAESAMVALNQRLTV